MKGQEVTNISGKLEEITQEELHNLLLSPNTIRVIIENNEMGGTCGMSGVRAEVHTGL